MRTSQEIDGLFTKVKRSFVDLDISLAKNPITDDAITLKNEKAVTQAIKNIILTKFGEKLMDPSIGCDVHSMLFEPLDVFSAMEIQSKIEAAIANYEPRIQIISVEVKTIDNELGEILVDLVFRIVGEPNIIEQTFLIERPSS